MPDVLTEYAYLWDGSQAGWVLVRSPELASGFFIFNQRRSVMLLVEDDGLNERLCQRMKEAGCEVLDDVPPAGRVTIEPWDASE